MDDPRKHGGAHSAVRLKLKAYIQKGSIPRCSICADTVDCRQTNSFTTCEDRSWLSHHISGRKTLIELGLMICLDHDIVLMHAHASGRENDPGSHQMIKTSHARRICINNHGTRFCVGCKNESSDALEKVNKSE